MNSDAYQDVDACPQCGRQHTVKIYQVVIHKTLRWSESINCPKCGLQSEADGRGFPPPEIREHLLRTGGAWCVQVTEYPSKVALLRVLRENLKLSLNEVKRISDNLPGMVFLGTYGEATWLHELIGQVGAIGSVDRV